VVDFLEAEFGIHRQTAFNWMKKGQRSDGATSWKAFEKPTVDEPDASQESRQSSP